MSIGGGGGGSYRHSGYTSKVLSDSAPVEFEFTAAANMLVNELNVRSASMGNFHTETEVSIFDFSANAQVGKKVYYNAPQNITGTNLLTGFFASLFRGRKYKIVFSHKDFDISTMTVGRTEKKVFSNNLTFTGYSATDPVWRIPLGNGSYYSIGGWQSYKSTGTFTRTLDMGTVSSNLGQDGIFLISDIVPVGTSMSIDLYFTDSDVISEEASLLNWDFFISNAEDGISLPRHRYWRVVTTMNSNTSRDFSPEVADFSIEYRPEPKTFGTVVDTNKTVKTGFFIKAVIPMIAQSSMRIRTSGEKNLSSVNLQSTKVNPRFQSTINGGFSAVVAEDDYSNSVFAKNLSAKECRIRVGYRNVDSTIELYKARIKDASYRKGSFTLMASDNFTEFGTMIPADKSSASWDGSLTYNSGDKVVFFASLYSAIQTNVGSQPDTNPLDWNAVGGAWSDIIYDETTHLQGSKWHLVDILLDLIKNHINIHSSKIDFDSFELVKTRLPDRIGTLHLIKPVKASSVVNEASWLLESHVVTVNGKITLLKEPSLTDGVDAKELKREDILENSLSYKAGWEEIKNQCIILSAYDNSTSDNKESFGGGEVVVDADSVTEFDTVSTDVFKDKFNIGSSELQVRASNFVGKWKRGRGTVKFNTDISNLGIEVLDIVSINSEQLPKFTDYKKTGIVVSKDLDWLNQKISLTILEIPV